MTAMGHERTATAVRAFGRLGADNGHSSVVLSRIMPAPAMLGAAAVALHLSA